MILNILKSETTSLHKEIERMSPAYCILDHTISEEEYRKFLMKSYKGYLKVEKGLESSQGFLPEPLTELVTSSEKGASLARDLSRWQTIDEEDAFSIDSLPEAIGALYVIEGSLLGAHMIYNHLDQCENLKSISRHHFYEQAKNQASHRWGKFRYALKEVSLDKEETERAVSSAKRVFALFA